MAGAALDAAPTRVAVIALKQNVRHGKVAAIGLSACWLCQPKVAPV
jgi:hypothetical protein